jgi:PIN domain nuclease of toxin-antitoxin system
MRYLLDTYTFLWTVFEPEKIGVKAKALITNPKHAILVSLVSFWEISLKYSLGKLHLENVSPAEFPAIAKTMDMEILEIDAVDVSTFHELPRVGHRDPFDRLIIRQAIRRKIPVVTKDEDFKLYKPHGLRIVW